ncbi:MAG TPA: hypothetical protein VLE27_10505 [Thermoanaerobaculia bacterium]|nr:hypothetical protein [Thermoanaerobaculia bacterium]
MLIEEFNSRFVAEEETSFLFQVMRKLSLLDTQMVLAGEVVGWGEWPPDSDDPDGPGFTRLTVQVA